VIDLQERRPTLLKEQAELLKDEFYETEDKHSESSSSAKSEEKYDYE